MTSGSGYHEELVTAVAAARRASQEILQIYDAPRGLVRYKADGSPVTEADLRSDEVIRDTIAAQYPNDPVLTEESQDQPERLASRRCWLVDPLDGTQQFMQRTGRFDILIALVIDHRPVVGVSRNPVTNTTYMASLGGGAWVERPGERLPLRYRPAPPRSELRLVSSIWYDMEHATPSLYRIAATLNTAQPIVLDTNVRPVDMLADASYDAFIGFAPFGPLPGGEWDFASVDLIVHEAGGFFTALSGDVHTYNKPLPKNRGGLLVTRCISSIASSSIGWRLVWTSSKCRTSRKAHSHVGSCTLSSGNPGSVLPNPPSTDSDLESPAQAWRDFLTVLTRNRRTRCGCPGSGSDTMRRAVPHNRQYATRCNPGESPTPARGDQWQSVRVNFGFGRHCLTSRN